MYVWVWAEKWKHFAQTVDTKQIWFGVCSLEILSKSFALYIEFNSKATVLFLRK